MDTRDRLAEVREHKRQSFEWMSLNFYPELEKIYKSYICKRDPEMIPGTLTPDYTRSSIESPNTFAAVWRTTARLTQQVPNIRFRSREKKFDNLIGTTLMWDWDAGGVQAIQKRHVRQAALFGLSIRAWWWEKQVSFNPKRVDVKDMAMPEPAVAAIVDFYAPTIDEWMMGNRQIVAAFEQFYQQPANPIALMMDEQVGPVLRAYLLAKHGRGGLLPIEYYYCSFEGPRTEFLFLGDCYPEPRFQTIQSSRWFIVERRRDREWLENLVAANPEDKKLAENVAEILRKFPNGTPYRPYGDQYSSHLRERLYTATGIADGASLRTVQDTGYYTITEEHTPGLNSTIAYVLDGTEWIGEIPYPYTLGRKIAFSEARVMDNLLHGVGDTPARVLNPLQEVFSRVLSRQSDAMDFVLRPLIGTNDTHVFHNPEMIKPMLGYRLALLRGGPNSVWTNDVSGVANAARSSYEFTAEMYRSWQLGSGESNVSMMAGVDPAQSRTATGAKLLQANLDVLTKDQIDMINTAVRGDAEIMFMLNRSELSDPQNIDVAKYDRRYRDMPSREKAEWATVEPLMFQEDGQIEPEIGSTLADDDEWKAQQATMLFQMFNGHPLVNQQTLRDEVLIAFNKGRELEKWAAEPQPPQPEPNKPKASLSISARLDQLPPEVVASLLAQAEAVPPDAQPINVEPPAVPVDPNRVLAEQTKAQIADADRTVEVLNAEADRELEEEQTAAELASRRAESEANREAAKEAAKQRPKPNGGSK